MAASQKLEWLFRGLTKSVMAYTFLARPPLQVKKLLQANSTIDPLDQLLECTQIIIRKSPTLEELVIIAAKSTTRAYVRMTCYRCNSQSHSARECERWRACMHCYWWNKKEYMAWDCLEKWGQGGGISISLFPKHLDETLLVIIVWVNRMLCSVLLDSGTSCTIVSKKLRSTWRKKKVLVITIKSKTKWSWNCWDHYEGQKPKVNMLVGPEKLLSFDLLFRYYAINLLGSIHITHTRAV